MFHWGRVGLKGKKVPSVNGLTENRHSTYQYCQFNCCIRSKQTFWQLELLTALKASYLTQLLLLMQMYFQSLFIMQT